MEITRRFLLASIAAVAGACASRVASLPLASPPPPAKPLPLEGLIADIQWAHAELMAALEADDFSAWTVDSDDEKPNRFRLARSLVLSRELDLSDPVAATISGELESLWRTLACPSRTDLRQCWSVGDDHLDHEDSASLDDGDVSDPS